MTLNSIFISPMLAASMPKTPLTIRPGELVAEEKFDGHRLILARHPSGEHTAWSRYGKVRVLPSHLQNAVAKLPVGIYDGELLVPGQRSYGVTELINGPDLVFIIFDILELMGTTTMAMPWSERRKYLNEIQYRASHVLLPSVRFSEYRTMNSHEDIALYCGEVWSRDGEGLILKRVSARYYPGKRPKDAWTKIKALRTAVLTVIGFQPGRGAIQDRGPYATVVLQDEDGNVTTVKTRNDEELEKFNEQAKDIATEFSLGALKHPAIGRKLRIEYQERTPDGNYRHPRWDRWEDE